MFFTLSTTRCAPAEGCAGTVEKAGSHLRQLYRAPGLPTTYFVDQHGMIASLVVGPLTPQVLAERLAEIQ